MGRGPVKPPTGWTAGNPRLRLFDVKRKTIADLPGIGWLERVVAAYAAAEGRRQRIDLEMTNHLENLLGGEITFYKKRRPQSPAPKQAGIAGEQDALLGQGLLDDVFAFSLADVGAVEAHDAQPLCEAPEHAIGEKIT